jgi:hypothetical protein
MLDALTKIMILYFSNFFIFSKIRIIKRFEKKVLTFRKKMRKIFSGFLSVYSAYTNT